MVRLRFLLLPILISVFISTYSQFTYQKFYHLTRYNGLSQSTVNCIVKDSIGYMWFGTNDGLNKYDGYKFTHYKFDQANPRSIGLGRIRTLYIDRKGRLWAGTDQGGLYLYREKYDNFIRYPRSLDRDSKGLYNDIRDILETDNGQFWIATNGNGLILYNPKNDSVIEINTPQILNINTIEFYEDDLFIGSESGVFQLKGGRNGLRTREIPHPISKLTGISIFKIHAGVDGLLWIGTYGNGAYAYDPKTGNTTEYSTHQQAPRRLNHDIIRDFVEGDDSSTLIMATGGGGLNILDRQRNEITYIKSKLNDQSSLNTDIIYTFYRDDINNLWIGTYNGGVNVLFRAKDKFGHIKSFGGEFDISNNSVLSIIEAGNGKLWVGTDGGGLNLFNPSTGISQHFRHNPLNSNSLSGDVIKTLLLDSRGKLWAGTFNKGLTVFDPASNRFTRYYYDPSDTSGLSQNHIWDIAEDKDGNVWLATLGGGLDMFDVQMNRFTHYRNNPSSPTSLSDNVLSSILYDSKGNLWIGTEFGGVNKLIDKNKGIFKVYNRGDSKGLISSNQISSIFEDSNQNIWVGTIGGGLNLYIESEDRFISYTEADGLASNLIYGMLEDNAGNLWLSTNNGLSEFINGTKNTALVSFKNYSIGDGLQSNEFSPQSACKTSDGVLYFGGINGINYFNPAHIIFNDHIPPIVITDLKIFNKSVTLGASGSPLSKPISQTREIKLSYKQSMITFEFAALDFTMPTKNQYKYMLEGFETKWNDVGNMRIATYTNLNPGKYIFKVVGSNNDDKWNLKGASIHLIITPPFWKTWLFRIALLITCILLILAFYRLKLRSLENNKKVLKNLVDERTRDLLNLNHLLEKQNKEIQFHREELLVQKENLIKINHELARKQDKIQEQNEELEKHRHNLEELVNQRTSELEKAKLKAEEADRLKSSFLSNMSHEIRTPLNAIVGFSALIAESDSTTEERNEFIKQINNSSETLLVLIDDILDLSKIESNQLKIISSEINVHEFMDELYTSFSLRQKPALKLLLATPQRDKNLVLVSDRTRLKQILTNLLDNAFKFTEEGYIKLGAELSAGTIIFCVEDSGIGMSEMVLNKIFDRFYKSDENTQRIYRGTGLGLTITKKLVKLLGGEISVSSNEGNGSSFKIVLPCSNS
jgi:signal transduction histidine kinase/ligand-binding sensor domain-containing protein